jgi:hypothetical protein
MGAIFIDEAESGHLVPEEDVLGDGELRDDCQFLVHDDDALCLALCERSELHVPSIECDRPLERAVRMHAAEDLHERRLPRAVLAADRMDLTASHLERNVIQRRHAAESLGDARHAQHSVRHRTTSSRVDRIQQCYRKK